MNDQSAKKQFNWKTLLAGGVVLVALIVAVIWNVRKFQELRAERTELVHWNRIDASEQAKVDQLDEWTSVSSETFDRIDDDHWTLMSMYRSVRTVDDFFPIHADHIVFKYDSFEDNRFRLLFFAPEGIHRLGIRVQTRWDDLVQQPKDIGAGEANVAEESPVDPKATTLWFNDLEGGQVYEAVVTLVDAEDERAMLQIALTDYDPIEERLGRIIKSGGHSWSVEHSQMIALPGQIRGDVSELGQKIFVRNRAILKMRQTPLVEYGCFVTRQSDGRDGKVHIGLFLESEGPLKSLPTNRGFHSNHLVYLKAEGRSNPFKGLKYDDRGWYYIETQDSRTK